MLESAPKFATKEMAKEEGNNARATPFEAGAAVMESTSSLSVSSGCPRDCSDNAGMAEAAKKGPMAEDKHTDPY